MVLIRFYGFDAFQIGTFNLLLQTYPMEMLRNYELCNDIDDCLDQLNWRDDMAVAVPYERIQSSKLLSGSHIFCFNKNDAIYRYDLKFLIRKDFPFFNELNEFIEVSSQAGLINKWLKMNEKQPKYIDKKNINGKATGSWFVVTGMMLVATLTFFAERLIYKKLERPNPSTVWIIGELAIDPERHFLLNDLNY